MPTPIGSAIIYLDEIRTVGIFPLGESPYGAMDMSGNVWEWCRTAWVGNYDDYPDRADDRLDGSACRTLRGGAWGNLVNLVRCAARFRLNPGYRLSRLGFRVVVSSSPGS